MKQISPALRIAIMTMRQITPTVTPAAITVVAGLAK